MGLTVSNVAHQDSPHQATAGRDRSAARRSHDVSFRRSCARLWQRQALDAPRISLPICGSVRDALQQTRPAAERSSNTSSASAGVAVGAVRRWNFILAHPMSHGSGDPAVAFARCSASCAQWHRRASARRRRRRSSARSMRCSFYRQQLETQRDARRGNWRWWVPPLVPGCLLAFLSLFVEVQPTPGLPSPDGRLGGGRREPGHR